MSAEWETRLECVWSDESLDDDTRVESVRVLAADAPHPAVGLFELASALDGAGHETEAVEVYEQAAAAGLARADPEREAHRLIQHASTLRNCGRYDEAIAMLQAAPDHPQVGTARAAFLALALHSAGQGDAALRVAIEALVTTMPLYRRALTEYAAELTDHSRQKGLG